MTLPETPNYGLQKGICRWITALAICHKVFLRGEEDLKEQLQVSPPLPTPPAFAQHVRPKRSWRPGAVAASRSALGDAPYHLR